MLAHQRAGAELRPRVWSTFALVQPGPVPQAPKTKLRAGGQRPLAAPVPSGRVLGQPLPVLPYLTPHRTAKQVLPLQFTDEPQVARAFYQREKPRIEPCSFPEMFLH